MKKENVVPDAPTTSASPAAPAANAIPQDHRKRVRILISIALAVVLVAGLLIGGGLYLNRKPKSTEAIPNGFVVVAASYDEVFDALTNIVESSAALPFVSNSLAPQANESIAGLEDSFSNRSEAYSKTNVQVEGIDEGDIVKTDGNCIYMVIGSYVVIVQTNGVTTKEIARLDMREFVSDKSLMDNKESVSYQSFSIEELYISNNSLIILYTYSLEAEGSKSSDSPSNYISPWYMPWYQYHSITEIACFNISNPQSPRLVNTFGQDGSYLSSRLQEGILYLVSNYWIYDTTQLDREIPGTYVPSYYDGVNRIVSVPEDISILPEITQTTYTVISSVDIAQNKRVDRYSALGSNGTLYMSYDNLYLASYSYVETTKDIFQGSVLTATEHRFVPSTRIFKLSLNHGVITYSADTLVKGQIIGQFALDEFEGNLRVVTTVFESLYRTVYIGGVEIFDHAYRESSQSTNSLFVLNASLQKIGSIEGLAEDERVYSVRFDGAVGYFVTFRQTDPLFAVDLSDPTNPRIQSELKIPGFSTYLHVYETDRLLGLGMSADAEGRTQYLKLSMFDTSDPYNITEKHTFEVRYHNYSAALYNHKAMLIDAEKNLIGFSISGNEYAVFGYSDEEGFFMRQTFKLSELIGYDTLRGLWIGDYFYVCMHDYLGQCTVGVYTLEDLRSVTSVSIKVENAYRYPYLYE